MGLQAFPSELPVMRDKKVAKNYLKADGLRVLNNLLSDYFDIV